jgi:hypothetical protein
MNTPSARLKMRPPCFGVVVQSVNGCRWCAWSRALRVAESTLLFMLLLLAGCNGGAGRRAGAGCGDGKRPI